MIERPLHAMSPTPRADNMQEVRLTRRAVLAGSLRSAFALASLAALGTAASLGSSGCARRDAQAQRIGALVGLDVEHGAVRSDGEGSGSVGVFEVTFTGEQADDVEEQIADTPSWHTLPLATALEAALYGPADMALALLDDAQDGFVRIEQGWWYFENHAQDSGGTAADGGPAGQASAESSGINPENAAITQAFVNASTVGLHLTIGLYDSQAHALFVYTLDSDR